MKKIVAIVVLLGLFSCSEKEVQLPQAEVSVLKDIVDHSPIYMFFEIQNKKDTIIDVNRKNSISSTNWVFNIDKRLPLKLVIPEVIKLQENLFQVFVIIRIPLSRFFMNLIILKRAMFPYF